MTIQELIAKMSSDIVNLPLKTKLNPYEKEKAIAATVNILTNTYREIISIGTLTEKLNLDKVSDYHKRVELREAYVKAHPDVEHWDYAEHIPYKGESIEGPYKLLLISTLGNIRTFNQFGNLHDRRPQAKVNQYARVRFKDNDYNGKSYLRHRLLASTFITVPEEIRDELFLIVPNHLNGIKFDNRFDNIEWTTSKGNLQHAIENGFIKTGMDREDATFYMGEVKTKNRFFTRKLVVCGTREIANLGLNEDSILYSIRTEGGHHCGCKWSKVDRETAEKIRKQNNSDLLEAMVHDKSYMNYNTVPIVAVINSGKYEGLRFSFYGAKEINRLGRGFNQGHVSKVCNGKLKSHKGCYWYQTSFDEADRYPRGIPDYVLDSIPGSKFGRK